MSLLIAIGKAIGAALAVAVDVVSNIVSWLVSPSGQQAVEIVISIFSMANSLFDLLEDNLNHLRTRKVVATWQPQPQ